MQEEINEIRELWRDLHPDDSIIEVTMIRRGQYAVDIFDEDGTLIEHHTTLKDWVTLEGGTRRLIRGSEAVAGE